MIKLLRFLLRESPRLAGGAVLFGFASGATSTALMALINRSLQSSAAIEPSTSALVFALILLNKDTVSVAVFAILFGFTFWITAPLAVIFVRNAFGARHVGALSGLITCIHHMCGGLGAWLGALVPPGRIAVARAA